MVFQTMQVSNWQKLQNFIDTQISAQAKSQQMLTTAEKIEKWGSKLIVMTVAVLLGASLPFALHLVTPLSALSILLISGLNSGISFTIAIKLSSDIDSYYEKIKLERLITKLNYNLTEPVADS